MSQHSATELGLICISDASADDLREILAELASIPKLACSISKTNGKGAALRRDEDE